MDDAFYLNVSVPEPAPIGTEWDPTFYGNFVVTNTFQTTQSYFAYFECEFGSMEGFPRTESLNATSLTFADYADLARDDMPDLIGCFGYVNVTITSRTNIDVPQVFTNQTSDHRFFVST